MKKCYFHSTFHHTVYLESNKWLMNYTFSFLQIQVSNGLSFINFPVKRKKQQQQQQHTQYLRKNPIWGVAWNWSLVWLHVSLENFRFWTVVCILLRCCIFYFSLIGKRGRGSRSGDYVFPHLLSRILQLHFNIFVSYNELLV